MGYGTVSFSWCRCIAEYETKGGYAVGRRHRHFPANNNCPPNLCHMMRTRYWTFPPYLARITQPPIIISSSLHCHSSPSPPFAYHTISYFTMAIAMWRNPTTSNVWYILISIISIRHSSYLLLNQTNLLLAIELF